MSAETGPESAFKLNSTTGPAFRGRAYLVAERRIRVRLEEGFDTVLLTGDSGTGKTRLLSTLSAELSRTCPVVLLAQPPFNAREALEKWRDIEAARGSRPLIALIDDADYLPPELQLAARDARLEKGATQVQFVLAVKPTAYARLAGSAAHLEEAMACCALGRLEDDEIADFVAHRLESVGADPRYFTREALAHVALCAQGVPGLVNLICAKACLVAAMNDERRVSEASVEEAAFVLKLGDISVGRHAVRAGLAMTAA